MSAYRVAQQRCAAHAAKLSRNDDEKRGIFMASTARRFMMALLRLMRGEEIDRV